MQDRLLALVQTSSYDEAVDLVFSTFDELLCNGKFVECDHVISSLKPEILDDNCIVAILTVTWAAKEKLATRAGFVERAEKHLREIEPERVERLLVGLI